MYMYLKIRSSFTITQKKRKNTTNVPELGGMTQMPFTWSLHWWCNRKFTLWNCEIVAWIHHKFVSRLEFMVLVKVILIHCRIVFNLQAPVRRATSVCARACCFTFSVFCASSELSIALIIRSVYNHTHVVVSETRGSEYSHTSDDCTE